MKEETRYGLEGEFREEYFARTGLSFTKENPATLMRIVSRKVRLPGETKKDFVPSYYERVDLATLDWQVDGALIDHIINGMIDWDPVTKAEAEAILERWRKQRA